MLGEGLRVRRLEDEQAMGSWRINLGIDGADQSAYANLT